MLGWLVKFMFSKKTTRIDEIFAIDLTLTTYCKIDGEDFFNFCGLLRKHELYLSDWYGFPSEHGLIDNTCSFLRLTDL